MTRLAVVAAAALTALAPPAALATGGDYIGNSYVSRSEVEEYVCVGKGGITDVDVGEVTVVGGALVIEITATCGDGSQEVYTLIEDTGAGNPNYGGFMLSAGFELVLGGLGE